MVTSQVLSPARLENAYQTAFAALLNERHPDGYWVGELSTSALSTATAVMALFQTQKALGHSLYQSLIDGGLQWLVDHQNEDGGWGDTVKSLSNISTTMLCRAAFYMIGAPPRFALAISRAETWLFSRYGPTPAQLAEAVRQRYGKDRTFAVPILTTCALAGLVSWREVPPLPFELAVFPQSWFRFLRLQVVSYALPALIAIGRCIYYHKKPWNPFSLVFRWLARRRSMKVLERIQPSNGGFLEATPLTSFVCLSLASCGLAGHRVVERGSHFIANSVRPDGSWPIDTNLSTWVTTLAVNALARAGEELYLISHLPQTVQWLCDQQHKERHPYTGAEPGCWAWTPLPGGVPDGDDTPGAILALRSLSHCDKANIFPAQVSVPAIGGLGWLRDLQNNDGGWPTFCKGWGHLPFDRSGPDLTSHSLRAIHAWKELWDRSDCPRPQKEFAEAIRSGFHYLTRTQRPDGSWLPLWFGNQLAPHDENPTYGTARVLAAYRDLGMMNANEARRGVAWLLSVQNSDGGWGGAKETPSSIEETSLAVEVLLDAGLESQTDVDRGLAWLVERIEAGGLSAPTPIGFYFAKLWYYEKLYPIIFAVAALGRARQRQRGE